MNQKEHIIKSKKIDYIYEHSESPIEGYPNLKLKLYSIHDGYKLYEIDATYAKQLKPNKYYVLARNKSEAKDIFRHKYTWLNMISSITECDKEMVEYIISHPALFPIS